MNRLYEKGFIHIPVSRAKPVGLTEEGLREAERLFRQYFVRSSDPRTGAGSM
jgi:Mn-dependent DtxR family transcriptional regulator